MPVNEFVKPGDPITAARFNELALAAFGRQANSTLAQRRRFFVKNNAATAMIPGAVGTIDLATAPVSQDPHLILNMIQGGYGLVVTNDESAIPAGIQGQVRIIGCEPTQVLTDETVAAGDLCGPVNADWYVTRGGLGLIALTPSSNGRLWVVQDYSSSWIVETTTTISAASLSTGTWTFGYGSVKVKNKNAASYAMDDRTGPITITAASGFPYAIPSGHLLLATHTQSGVVQLHEWLTRPHLFCRFHLSAALATTDSSKGAVIDTYFGYGADHASTTIIVKNLAATTDYLFEGANGAKGLAYYDPASGSTTWQIVQMECPTT